ncbi:MarR family transcriptional regulator [Cohnella lubricantis]|uniref:MarR family transcriptional regulator n=1 Tax=Cohnella lubricantis TaxID=2163172 RepID=A0A841T5U7_9BACL|nr:MarR family transcriptional regulator [Cohnella lubricantis]MBB6676694.1 MarR family transcriptional regulator [Cohnella lubricantis]MBP2117740.1 DNA-binding MarR family transcriptional regulator [Cohnella lubricantis]
MDDQKKLLHTIERYKSAMFAINRRMNLLMRELVPEDLTVDQYLIMSSILSQGQCTHSELADIFCVGKSSITAIISRLFDKNLIRRIPDEKDRRVVYLALTEEGERVAREADAALESLLAGYWGHFGEEEIDQFMRTYEKLASVLQNG